MKKVFVSIVLMVIMFFISGLFFLNSGMFDEDGEFGEEGAVEILLELDKIPFVDIDMEDMRFDTYGTVMSVNEGSLFVSLGDKDKEFIYYGNLSGLEEDDKVVVLYRYSLEGEVEVVDVMGFVD